MGRHLSQHDIPFRSDRLVPPLAYRAPQASLLVVEAPDRDVLLGFGIFNTVEGIIDHHLIGIHHVNETVGREYWPIWDTAFTLWGAGMIIIGWMFMRAGQRETSQ